jgi:hypothetical protein
MAAGYRAISCAVAIRVRGNHTQWLRTAKKHDCEKGEENETLHCGRICGYESNAATKK